jgi:hypothetical protein
MLKSYSNEGNCAPRSRFGRGGQRRLAVLLKTHNAVVATGSVKNMVLGAPLRSVTGETPVWTDKHVHHAMPPNRDQIGVTENHHAMNYSVARLPGR